MTELRFTLISDGSSDRALIPIIRWSLIEAGVGIPINDAWADFALMRHPPNPLSRRIHTAAELWPCDVLFVHRDCEKTSLAARRDEIHRAVAAAGLNILSCLSCPSG